jgi:hypothetical protein
MCEVWEIWLDDDNIDEVLDEEGEKSYKKRFPHGRLITMLPNQNIVLQDVENPYKHGHKPYVRFVDTVLPRQFWGEGEAEPLMDIQRVINKIMSVILDYMNLMGNPVWVIESGSGVDSEQITNQCGLIIETAEGKSGTVRREIPPPLPQYIQELYQTMLNMANMISGVGELSNGARPIGITAAAAIETLQEASQTRIRQKARNMETALSQMGYLIVSLMMQFYRTPRVAKITGDNEWPEYFEFYIQDTDDGRVVYNKKDYQYDKANKSYIPATAYEASAPSKGVFDVKVMAGTSLPFAKTQRSNVAFKLFDSQVIDAKELLDTLEWPNADQIVERMQQSVMAQQAQAQQLPQVTK